MMRRLWAAPGRALGVAAGCLAGGRLVHDAGIRWHLLAPEDRGCRVLKRFRVLAMTVGSTVLIRDWAWDHEELRAHEAEHALQWERWGPLFLPAYLSCYLWGRARGKGHLRSYRDNWFEKQARESE